MGIINIFQKIMAESGVKYIGIANLVHLLQKEDNSGLWEINGDFPTRDLKYLTPVATRLNQNAFYEKHNFKREPLIARSVDVGFFRTAGGYEHTELLDLSHLRRAKSELLH